MEVLEEPESAPPAERMRVVFSLDQIVRATARQAKYIMYYNMIDFEI
jgi:hypothetical protein